ncbi:MAG TPA: hypothetical protein VFP65_16155 [Anaeromyxobacteraceae bacterium]|nr:hypothetical protein [Anaeromyxobacteraceae bacterium]
MRALVAIAAAVLVLLVGAAPHAHEGQFGTHACVACAAASGDAARSATPDVSPGANPCGAVSPAPAPVVAVGFPRGAVPGQSPPRA